MENESWQHVNDGGETQFKHTKFKNTLRYTDMNVLAKTILLWPADDIISKAFAKASKSNFLTSNRANVKNNNVA